MSAPAESIDVEPVLLPYQAAWVDDRSPVKVCSKSRRIGITWATGYEAVEVASASDMAGGSDFYYQVYAEDDAKDFIDECAKWARAFAAVFTEESTLFEGDEARENFVLADGESSILVLMIRFASGHKIVGLSRSPRKLRGKKGVYCLDEAAYHDDVDGALVAAGAFRVWGGRVIIISTQDEAGNKFNTLIEDIKGGRGYRAKYSLHEVTLPEAVEQGLFRRICQVNGWEWSKAAEIEWVEDLLASEGAETEYLCVPRKSGLQYFARDVVQACMTRDATVIRYAAPDGFLQRPEEERETTIEAWCADELAPLLAKLPKDKPHYLGEDFGRSSDLTVLAPGFEAQDLALIVPFIIELENVPYESQRQIVFYVLERLPRFTGAAFDATGNGAYLAEQALARWGEVVIECVHMSEAWYALVLPKLRARFQEQEILIPQDLDILQDLSQFERINGIPKLPKIRNASKSAKGKKRHGDSGVALACLVHARDSHPSMSGRYKPVPKRGGHFSRKGIF